VYAGALPLREAPSRGSRLRPGSRDGLGLRAYASLGSVTHQNLPRRNCYDNGTAYAGVADAQAILWGERDAHRSARAQRMCSNRRRRLGGWPARYHLARPTDGRYRRSRREIGAAPGGPGRLSIAVMSSTTGRTVLTRPRAYRSDTPGGR